MNVPSVLTAGDSATWLDDPTSDAQGGAIDSTWTLKFVFSNSASPTVTVTSTANGSGWTSTLTKANTAALGAGEFYWQAYAETGSRRETIGSGKITIKAAAATLVTGKSQARQDLDAVQSAMRAMISGGAVAEYTIGGRSLRKIPMQDLLLYEGRLKTIVAREDAAASVANGLGNPRAAFVRFK